MNTRSAPPGFNRTTDGTIARVHAPLVRGEVVERRCRNRFEVDDILYRHIRTARMAK